MSKQQYKLANSFAVLFGMLQDRPVFFEDIFQGVNLPSKITALLICSSLFFGIYGGIIGASHSWQQAVSSAVKLPALYLITLFVCFPTLYFFSIFLGSKKSFGQYLTMLLAAVSIIGALLFSFAPVALFFQITTKNYQFIILLNVAIFAIASFTGIKILYKGMQAIAAQDAEGLETRQKLLKFWLILYAFVGTQMAWTLRPFFGRAGTDFVLFRAMEGNFYVSVWLSLREMLGLY